MLPVLGKKAVLEWCMKEGMIGSSYVCPKCGKSTELRERTVYALETYYPDSPPVHTCLHCNLPALANGINLYEGTLVDAHKTTYLVAY
ncbi:hypothetical protein TNCV_4999541 [Trichonephila clavipes]|nr:hypothetical protein TNCV_4999541 [Trichonephila clavipes]